MPFSLEHHNEMYEANDWIHKDDCLCKRPENQPKKTPRSIKQAARGIIGREDLGIKDEEINNHIK